MNVFVKRVNQKRGRTTLTG